MAAWLSRRGTGERWKLTTLLDNVIGRHPHVRVRLALDALSRKHTLLRLTPRGWEASDLGSSGGTFIAQGGARAARVQSCLLRPGDVLVYPGAELEFADDGQAPDESDSPAGLTRELLRLIESGGEPDAAMFLLSELLQLPTERGTLLEKLMTAPDLQKESGRSLAASVISELSVHVDTHERPGLLTALEQLANDGAPSVRVLAVHGLGRHAEGLPALRQALFDSDHAVFEAALQWLRRWKMNLVKPLEQLLETVSADRASRVAAELEAERR